MIKYIYLLILSTTVLFANSQNLVPNFSFEEFVECPREVTFDSMKELIPYWQMPTRGTSDYYNGCSLYQVNVPDNVMGNMFALDGQAYAGIILIEQPQGDTENKKALNYREYLQSQLISPLTKDSLYSVKFYFSIASYSTYAINKLGLHVSESKIGNRLNSKVLDAEAHVELDSNKVYNVRDYWYLVCDTFRAKGNEQYITIGNFNNDYETEIEKLDNSIYRGTIQQTIKENKIAYYYIDVVSVTKISDYSTACQDKHLIE